jgi:Fe-Mn family superoxide dismutase
MLTRREVLKSAAASAAALLVPSTGAAKRAAGFTLPKLPYAYDALEPHIDAKTMEIHHDKHHQAYVDGLNAALKDQPDWLSKPVDTVIANLGKLPEAIQPAVRNMGGGHYNHSMFWTIMKKDGGQPTGPLLKALEAAFGTFDGFQKAFTEAAMKRFGSGWAWLVPTGEKGLSIVSSPNQDNSVMDGKPGPIMGIDVWEHAYYLKYQNKRADYVKAWWNVVNWDQVAANLAAAKK